MLISYKYKFIFIHNYKVAGMSIKGALGNYALTSPSRFTLLNKITENFKWTRNLNSKVSNKLTIIPNYKFHAPASEIKRQMPENIWNSFYKFSFVRNPWDWQVSLYHYMLKSEYHFQHKLIKKMKSFDEYIEWRVSKDLHLQKDNICDEQGKILMDFVGKLETINDDFNKICKVIGVNEKLPHVNKSNHKNYRSYYNDYTKKLIEKYFKDDIELFDYEF